MPLTAKKAANRQTATGIPFEILRAAEESPYLRMGVFGGSGAGKTYLAATAQWYEHTAPVLIIDAYDSSDSVMGEEEFAGVEAIKIRTLDQLDEVFDWLWAIAQSGEVFPYKTIVLDEVDELHTTSMRELMRSVVKAHPERQIDLASQQEWGIVRNKFLRIIDGFRALPCNVIYLTVPNSVEIKPGKDPRRSFGLPGKLSDDMSKRLSLVAELEKDERKVKEGAEFVMKTKRVLTFDGDMKSRTKVRGRSRLERLGSEMVDPTMEKIFRAWYNI